MAQHGLYGRAVGTDEVKIQVGRMGEYDIPPDSAHLGEFIPPSFEIPSIVRVVCRVVYTVQVEYIKEDVMVQFIDSRTQGCVAPGSIFFSLKVLDPSLEE
jgi:hypothetical protein